MATATRPKRPYRIDPVVAHERARHANRFRNSPDSWIKSLEKWDRELTVEQKRRLARLLMPFLTEAGVR